MTRPPLPLPLRHRHREGCGWLLALVLAAALFSLWPTLDLVVAEWFHSARGFVGSRSWAVVAVYKAVPWVGRIGFILVLLIALWCWRRPRRIGTRWWRRSIAFAGVMLLGVALVVNGGLKSHTGRPRPHMVAEFGGQKQFQPALAISSQCSRNCSFVSGHAATGFALMALGLMGSPATRRRWWVAGLVAGTVIGLGRMAQGGHFLSDVVFAGLVIGLCGWALREAWLRQRVLQTAPARAAPRAARPRRAG